MRSYRWVFAGIVTTGNLLLCACHSSTPAPPTASEPPPTAPTATDDNATTAAPAPDSFVSGETDYAPEPLQVVSVYEQAPEQEPAAVEVASAPPPMLYEAPSPQPTPEDDWTGGYWAWQGNWVWVSGRWLPPPRPHYHWVQPYYEHRGDRVIFIDGFWGAADVRMVAPAPGLTLSLQMPGPGFPPGPPPDGPEGVFVPPPPGSRSGLIVPAPLGTPPAVVMGAPPVVNVGMRITRTVNETTINNTTTINNVTIYAPATATVNHQAVNLAVPAVARLAAMLPPVVRAPAPHPTEQRALPSFIAGSHVELPAPTTVRPVPVHVAALAAPRAVPAAPAPPAARAADAQRQAEEAQQRVREAQQAASAAAEAASQRAAEAHAAQARQEEARQEESRQEESRQEEARQREAREQAERAAEAKQKADEAKKKAEEAKAKKPPNEQR